jgi:hypothetical protein
MYFYLLIYNKKTFEFETFEHLYVLYVNIGTAFNRVQHSWTYMTVVEKRKVVLESRFCFQCLSFGHYKRTCRYAKCDYHGCYRRHHRLLHLNNLEPKKDQINVEKSEQRKVTTSDATAISPAHLLLQKPAVVLPPPPPGEFDQESVITRKNGDKLKYWRSTFGTDG